MRILLCSLLLGLSLPVHAQELRVLTTERPPFFYLEGGELPDSSSDDVPGTEPTTDRVWLDPGTRRLQLDASGTGTRVRDHPVLSGGVAARLLVRDDVDPTLL